MIVAVLFDLGDVVMEGNVSSLKRLAVSCGATEAGAQEALRGLLRPLSRGEIGTAELTQMFSSRLGIRLPQEEVDGALEGVHLHDDVVSIVSRLQGRCRLAIASNNVRIRVRAIEKLAPQVLSLFEKRYFSCDLGVGKPDEAFFSALLEGMGTGAQECLFIDDKEENCEAARALGMHAIRFESAAQLERELTAIGLL